MAVYHKWFDEQFFGCFVTHTHGGQPWIFGHNSLSSGYCITSLDFKNIDGVNQHKPENFYYIMHQKFINWTLACGLIIINIYGNKISITILLTWYT